MSSVLKQVSGVSCATVVSRFLGLFRDILMFAGFGAGPFLSAYLVAFTLPNLLRRLVGEGALTSAVVPVMSEQLERNGREASFVVLNRVLSRLFLALLICSLVCIFALMALSLWPGLSPRWVLAERFGALLFPYSIFVCGAAMLAAQMNVLHRFLIPALSSIWLNVVMIAALLGGLWLIPESTYARLILLCLAVLVGGALQLIIPALVLRRDGWKPRIDARHDDCLSEIWRLLLPGMAGAAILQVNLFLARMLALSIDDTAPSILYLANRLVELPYGVFAVAIATVAFPRLSRSVARGDGAGFRIAYEQGRNAICLICLPAAVGLIVLAQPIVTTLFEWGLFDGKDVRRTVLPLQILSLAMPFFSWTTLATRGLHSWKEMKLPVRVAGLNVVINLALGIGLMFHYAEVGLAFANLVASIIVTVLLEYALWKRKVIGFSQSSLWGLAKMAVACLFMTVVLLAWWRLMELFALNAKLTSVLIVCGGIPLGIIAYFGAVMILKVPEMKELTNRFRERFTRRERL